MEQGRKFAGPVDEGAKQLVQQVRKSASLEKNYLVEIPQFPCNQSCIEALLTSIKSVGEGLEIASELDNVGEEDRKNIESDLDKFNNGIQDRTRDYTLLLIFQHGAQEFLDEYLASFNEELSEDTELKGQKINSRRLNILNQLAFLVDISIEMYLNHLASTKFVFFQLIQSISDTLSRISTQSISTFWHYLETREDLIQSRIFDKKMTSDRISLLEICNGLTDKIYTGTKHKDSYRKDTFNDKFQFRVRIFLTNIFQFEDNTGLNKYFTLASRVVKESGPLKTNSWKDEVLQDIVKLNKILRDPYSCLKNPRALVNNCEMFKRLNDFLFEEEEAIKAPKSDPFLIKKSEPKDYLKQKYDDKMFFSENYWLSPFEETPRGPKYETMKKEDETYFMEHTLSKSRNHLLIQIYFISCLFYQLVGSNKKQLLKDINAPANIKHITDDATPESAVNIFFKIRKDMINRYKTIDTQLSFLLQHIQNSELHWWAWLIYSKDPVTGKPLFSDRELTDQDLELVNEKTASVIPFKEKRYFNTYGTPQLSRKMKVPTGLELLQKTSEKPEIDQNDIDQLTEKIKHSTDKTEQDGLVEERTVLQWKKLKQQRIGKWLDLGELLSEEKISAPALNDDTADPATNHENTKNTQESEPSTEVDMEVTETSGSRKRPIEEADDPVANDEPSSKKAKVESTKEQST